MPSATARIDLEGILLSDIRQKQTPRDFTYTRDLKSERINKTETDPKTQRTSRCQSEGNTHTHTRTHTRTHVCTHTCMRTCPLTCTNGPLASVRSLVFSHRSLHPSVNETRLGCGVTVLSPVCGVLTHLRKGVSPSPVNRMLHFSHRMGREGVSEPHFPEAGGVPPETRAPGGSSEEKGGGPWAQTLWRTVLP